MTYFHQPILVKPILDFFHSGNPDVIYDLTCGEGGHSEAFLNHFPHTIVVGVDQDPEIAAIAKNRLKPFGERFSHRLSNFSNTSEWLRPHFPNERSAFLLDLGISSFHFDAADRGFSFSRPDDILDMRLSSDGLSASDLLNTLSEKELSDVIYEFGEERFSRRIARRIKALSEPHKIWKTGDLISLIYQSIPRQSKADRDRIHPATRTFQALRIAVNQEIHHLRLFLDWLRSHLVDGNRVAIISFHSLEDREVKHTFRQLSEIHPPPEWVPGMQWNPPPSILREFQRKPIIADEDEKQRNPRSRSAKLRMAEVVPYSNEPKPNRRQLPT